MPRKIRRARLGPRFWDSNDQQPPLFRDAEDILGHPQYYLQGVTNHQEHQSIPSSSLVDTVATYYIPRPPAPNHWPTQSIHPASTFGSFPIELLRSPAPPLGGSLGFPAFHLTTPPTPPRPVSPPFKHPSELLRPNTVPLPVKSRTRAGKQRIAFPPAPPWPTDRPGALARLPSSSNAGPSTTTTNLPTIPTIIISEAPPHHQANNTTVAFEGAFEDDEDFRIVVSGNQVRVVKTEDCYISSYEDAKAFEMFHGYLDLGLVNPKFRNSGFGTSMVERFNCIPDPDCIKNHVYR